MIYKQRTPMDVVFNVGAVRSQRCHSGAIDFAIARMDVTTRFNLLKSN